MVVQTSAIMSMLFCMRTTLDLDDELVRAAKLRALQERRSLTSLIEDGLRALLHATPERVGTVVLPVWHGDGPAAGVDLADWESVERAAGADEEAGYRSGADAAS